MRKQPSMARWYDPVRLVRTGIRVAISTVFGEFADRREAIALANPIPPAPFDAALDYAARLDAKGEQWIDFLADTGDGWNSTLAMARLLTDVEIAPDGLRLPRGRVQILGGDQVYPVASRNEYADRLLGPLGEAFEALDEAGRADMPDLYAIPGNHDWYDGLAAFEGIFCRRRTAREGEIAIARPGRRVAGRETRQTRSYFAIRLAHGWWLWGSDSQLEGYIDQPQIEFFDWAARHWMEKGSKLILCVSEPSWTLADVSDPAPRFSSFSYLERLAGAATDADQQPMGHELKLVLSGDTHHYSRFESAGVTYVTSGGGGAFLHPTHHLRDRSFDWPYPPPGAPYDPEAPASKRTFTLASRTDGGPAVYPDMGASRRLAWRNLLFGALNPGMLAIYACAYLAFNWLLDFNAEAGGAPSLLVALNEGTFGDGLLRYAGLCVASPWPPLLLAAAFGAYRYFADLRSRAARNAVGALHWTAQIAAVALSTVAAARLAGPSVALAGLPDATGDAALLALAMVLGSIASTTVLGAYLLVSVNGFGRHWNEAFSSLRIPDLKNFLRIRIDAAGALHLHAVGLARVPRSGRADAPLAPHLIEGPLRIH